MAEGSKDRDVDSKSRQVRLTLATSCQARGKATSRAAESAGHLAGSVQRHLWLVGLGLIGPEPICGVRGIDGIVLEITH